MGEIDLAFGDRAPRATPVRPSWASWPAVKMRSPARIASTLAVNGGGDPALTPRTSIAEPGMQAMTSTLTRAPATNSSPAPTVVLVIGRGKTSRQISSKAVRSAKSVRKT